MARHPATIVIGLVVACGVVGLKFYNKGQDDSGVRKVAHQVCEQCPGYDKNGAYIDTLCNNAHKVAFDHAYKMGGRRTSTKFDEDAYWRELFTRMIGEANAEQRPDVAKSLTELQTDFLAQMK